MSPARWRIAVGLGLDALCFILPSSGFAQAWVPEKGTGTVTVSYQNQYIKNHVDFQGHRVFMGTISSSGVVHRLDYGVTDKLTLSFSLPYIVSKYNGSDPEGDPATTVDNGHYHGTFQDFRFTVRYNFRSHPLMLTPFVGTVVPSHNYQFFAHSAAGQNEHSLVLGIATGRRLDPILPRAYFQSQYSYAMGLQHVLGYRINRGQLSSEFGYFLTKRLTLVAVEDLLLTNGGIIDTQLTDQSLPIHDEILNMKHLDIGPGAGFQVSPAFDIYGAIATTIWGRDTHALHRAVVIGMNWNFRTRRAAPQVTESTPTTPPNRGRGVVDQASNSAH